MGARCPTCNQRGCKCGCGDLDDDLNFAKEQRQKYQQQQPLKQRQQPLRTKPEPSLPSTADLSPLPACHDVESSEPAGITPLRVIMEEDLSRISRDLEQIVDHAQAADARTSYQPPAEAPPAASDARTSHQPPAEVHTSEEPPADVNFQQLRCEEANAISSAETDQDKDAAVASAIHAHSAEVVAAAVIHLCETPTAVVTELFNAMSQKYPHLIITKSHCTTLLNLWQNQCEGKPVRILQALGYKDLTHLTLAMRPLALAVPSDESSNRSGRLIGRRTITWSRVHQVDFGAWVEASPMPHRPPARIKAINKRQALRKKAAYPGKKRTEYCEIGSEFEVLEFAVFKFESVPINCYRVQLSNVGRDSVEGWLLDYSPGDDLTMLMIQYLS